MRDLTNTYVIAEIGVNHNGSIKLAKDMISAPKAAGANAVKFQTFTVEALVSKGAAKVDCEKETKDEAESHFEMIRALELLRADHYPIIEYCRSQEIEFISTP